LPQVEVSVLVSLAKQAFTASEEPFCS
jgi:hypothetical protein